MFQANSPFEQLKKALFSGESTGRATSKSLSDIQAASDAYGIGSHMPTNRGVSRNIFEMTSGAGVADAARRAAPISQGMQDSQANAEWGLQRSNANEGFANNMLGNLVQNYQTNTDPRPQADIRGAFFKNIFPQMTGLLGNPAGSGMLSSLLGSGRF